MWPPCPKSVLGEINEKASWKLQQKKKKPKWLISPKPVVATHTQSSQSSMGQRYIHVHFYSSIKTVGAISLKTAGAISLKNGLDSKE